MKFIILAFNIEIFNNSKYWNHENLFWVQTSLDFDLSVSFSCSKLLVLQTEPGVLTCQVSSIFIILLSLLNSIIVFFLEKAKHHQKNHLSFHLRHSSLHPSRYSSFIHLSISTYLESLVWPAVNALPRDPKTNRTSFKFIDTTLGGDAHQPWQHNGRFKHAF